MSNIFPATKCIKYAYLWPYFTGWNFLCVSSAYLSDVCTYRVVVSNDSCPNNTCIAAGLAPDSAK